MVVTQLWSVEKESNVYGLGKYLLRNDHIHFLLGYIDALYRVAGGSVYVSLAHSRKNGHTLVP